MAIDFSRSWMNQELEMVRDTTIRFIESERAPRDEEARKQGHVGHEIWRKAGEVGLLCADIPAQALPDKVKDALTASAPFLKRHGNPDELAALAKFMIVTAYFNGESVRLDGGIRIAPR